MKSELLSGFLFIGMMCNALAQQPDSLQLTGTAIIGMQMEHLAELSDAGVDLSELTADLENFLENPLNLNEADKRDLKCLVFLNDVQIRNILDYRKKYGGFLSIFELKVIEGLGRNTLKKIQPFVVVSPPTSKEFKFGSLWRGKHDIIIRFQRKLANSTGYDLPPDSLQSAKSGSFYLGDPNRYYLRYRYRVGGRFSIGLIAEKDPGEMFLNPPSAISASIKQIISQPRGFDFYSFHIAIESKRILRYAVAGDYHARFGQGLTLWSGLSFSGGSDPSSLKRYASGIRPNTSANENMFFRGAATTLAWRRFELSLLYSRKKSDANIVFADSNGLPSYASSIPNTGYHRTLNELEDKNKFVQQHLGGNISFSGTRFQLGLTLCYAKYSLPIKRKEAPSNLYRFSGKENLNTGLDFNILMRKTNLFGELAASRNGGWALLAGLNHTTSNGSIFGLLYREYKPQYQNLLAQASGKKANNANERGIKLAMEIPLLKKLIFQAAFDHYIYPWISSAENNSHRGQEHSLRLFYSLSRHDHLSFRYRFRSATNSNDFMHGWLDSMVREHKHDIQFVAAYEISPALSGKLQAGYAMVKGLEEGSLSTGSMLLLDLYIRPIKFPVKLTFRYALFHTDDYDSRLYAYEHDVLYATSMPAYYGKGFRTYLLLKYSPARWMDAWLRFSLTCYTDRNTISSGPDEIKGNKLPEIKLQMRFKL